MIARTLVSDTFATAKTLDIDLGQAGFKQAAIFVPTLSSDSYVTVSLSYDGSTWLTLSMADGAASEYDVEIPSARVRTLDLAGARYIRLTAPSTNQTVTVYTLATG